MSKLIPEMIDDLVNQVDDMDLATVIELAKQAQRDFYEACTDEKIKEYHGDMG